MSAVLVLSLISLCLATDSLELSDIETKPSPSGPPFFVNVSTAAKTSYYKILNDKSLTRKQQAEGILKWGKENGIEPVVQVFVDRKAKELQDFRQNITIFLNQLLDYEKEVDAIYLDNDVTVSQRESLLESLKCPPALKKVLSYAATVVRRSGAPPPFNKSQELLPTVAVESVTQSTTKNGTILQ